jgi:hypothetical protein
MDVHKAAGGAARVAARRTALHARVEIAMGAVEKILEAGSLVSALDHS